ncbi:MAG: hypothetical protein CMF72_15975 [Mameliella sp.]|nr:hypothetical protein [Mameliella sp.]
MSSDTTQHIPARRIGLSSALFTVTAVLATLGALFDVRPALVLGATTLGLFVLIEFHRIPRVQQIAALVLVAIATVSALRMGDVLHVYGDGLVRTLPFLLVFAAVGWLRKAAEQSPSIQALRDGMGEMREGHRFLSLALSAHVMGAGFNLAGIGLLAPMLDGKVTGADTARRLRCAILWGFSTAASWSPFLVGTAAVLTALPAIGWTDALPYGLVMAAGFLIWSVVFDNLTRRNPPVRSSAAPPLGQLGLLRPVGRLLLAILVLFALTMGLIEGVGMALTTAIAIVGPLYATGWMLLVHGHRNGARVGNAAVQVISGYQGMRTETTLFVAANIFGVAMSEVLPGMAGDVLGFWQGGPTGVFFFDTLIILWIFLAICAIGIHPIVSLVVFTSAFAPDTLGIPQPLLAATMMALWGMGTSVSPLSGTTLIMSQLSAVSSFTIAWRWNGLFYFLSSFWVAAVITMAR